MLAGCSTDLGACPDDPALQAQGWRVLQRSCAGTTCHTSSAVGPRRNGVPSGLDWDVPGNVRSDAGEIWSVIDTGEMPPRSWIERVPDAEVSAEDAEAVRALLACGVPGEALP